MNKTVKVRKMHMCAECGHIIEVGEEALFYTERMPVYDKYDTTGNGVDQEQIGIVYAKEYFCKECMNI